VNKVKKILFTFLFITTTVVYSQNTNVKIKDVKEQIENLKKDVPSLNEKVKINVGKSTLQSFISGLGSAHNLNISVDPSLNLPVTINFSDETVANVLVYLVAEYDLELKITGTIMSFSKKIAPVIEKEIKVEYDKIRSLLSYDLENDNLAKTIKKIIELSGNNIIIDPNLTGKNVSGFIKGLELNSALEKLAFANDIELANLEDGTLIFKKKESPFKNNQSLKSNTQNEPPQLNTKDINLSVSKGLNGDDLISVSAINKSISDILKYMFNETNKNYIFFAEPNENTTLNIVEMPVDDFLSYVLNATDFTFKNNEDIYLFGLRSNEKLRNSKLLKLQYRSLQDVMAVIPGELKEGVSIQEFPELNSLVLSGSSLGILEIERMVRQIDLPVPVIMIELIIVDVNKTHNVSTGIEAGLSSSEVKTEGTFLPGLDVTLSSSTINQFLNTIGLTKLGRVTPSFYVSLSAMETNGNINIQSTPRLATLNSHEATLSIGETSYYLEQQQNVIGTQNPQTVVTNTYKPINADFSITINPTVSGDEQVTLEVSVNQSAFTTRISPSAPPGQTNRDFQSIIRVKNEEMIVLGGLERTNNSQTGSGLPGLSRIPVLRWFFGNRQKTKEKSKLIIFIKPTIIY